MKNKYEYKEGPEARENFERLAKVVFRAKTQKKRQPKKATAHKTSGKNKG